MFHEGTAASVCCWFVSIILFTSKKTNTLFNKTINKTKPYFILFYFIIYWQKVIHITTKFIDNICNGHTTNKYASINIKKIYI